MATAKKTTTKVAPKKVATKKKVVSSGDSFAVIETGGKQYLITEGSALRIEKMVVSDNDTITFDKVLLVHDGKKTTLGTPYIDGAKVEASVTTGAGRAKKILVVRYKAKSRYHKKNGHRQPFTEVSIKKV
ncbi:MAG: 50S ribosomal protein L21 [Candidatus Pacebacteria bacterium]|nr:50S ribosomal protein L21 [Candidatus Paceibacterota bacterium]